MSVAKYRQNIGDTEAKNLPNVEMDGNGIKKELVHRRLQANYNEMICL